MLYRTSNSEKPLQNIVTWPEGAPKNKKEYDKGWCMWKTTWLKPAAIRGKAGGTPNLQRLSTAGSSFENNSYPESIISTFHSSPDDFKHGSERLSTSWIQWKLVWKKILQNAKNEKLNVAFSSLFRFITPKNLWRKVDCLSELFSDPRLVQYSAR